MWKLGIITVAEIIHIVSELGKENKIVGNKSEEDLAAVLADTLCFADTFLFVRIIFQMIKRAEQKDNIKRLICISREVKGIAFECGNIGIGKFKSRDFITLTSKVEAVFTCTCANVEYLVAIFQIFFYVVNGSQKFNSCGFGMIEPCILVEYIVGSVYTFTLIFYFCKLFKVRFIYTSRFSHIN